MFTGADRYNYVDPDYAYTDEERLKIERHKEIYKQYIDNLKFYRKEQNRNKEYKAYNNAPNNDLKPGNGLKPNELTLSDQQLESARKSCVFF